MSLTLFHILLVLVIAGLLIWLVRRSQKPTETNEQFGSDGPYMTAEEKDVYGDVTNKDRFLATEGS